MSGSRAASAVACSGNRLLRPATFHVMRRTTSSHISFATRAAPSRVGAAAQERPARQRAAHADPVHEHTPVNRIEFHAVAPG
jgi:hypothetical protein